MEKRPPWRPVIDWDIIDEKNPYSPPTQVGGVFNNVSFGTPVITGGTINHATLGTPKIQGGTATSTILNTTTVGTPVITGGTYNAGVFGSPVITGGNYNTGTFVGTPVITGAAQTGGTHNNGVFGTPAIIGGTATSFTFSNKINVLVGANLSVGKGTLVTGVATISTTTVGADSNIFLTPILNGANLGILAVGTINAGTNFVVQSSNVLDSDSFNYWVIN